MGRKLAGCSYVLFEAQCEFVYVSNIVVLSVMAVDSLHLHPCHLLAVACIINISSRLSQLCALAHECYVHVATTVN